MEMRTMETKKQWKGICWNLPCKQKGLHRYSGFCFDCFKLRIKEMKA
jgi:hypothetical protein